MLGFYNYTVILTYLGMLFGFTGITYAAHGNIRGALLCLMMAGFCDMFDGKVASTRDRTAQEKRFGIQIDSLSDLICFGVLPAMIVYESAGSKFGFFAAGLYALCALIRLSWFNVDEEERQEAEDTRREVYLGLPVTTSALIFPLLLGLCQMKNIGTTTIAPAVMLVTALAFLTPVRLKKPARVGQLVVLLCGVLELLVLLMGVAD